MHRLISILALCSLALPSFSDESTVWAETAQNPMADIIKLPVNNYFDFGYGHKDQVRYGMNYTPSMVSHLSKNWMLLNRYDVSLIYQPGRVPGEKDVFGLSDTTYEGFYGPSGKQTIYWGLGPAFQIPTATTNPTGSKKWSAGLAGTGTYIKGPFVVGLRANHLWSFAGASDRPDINRTTIEYFAYANFKNGWWIGTSPINVANWDEPSDEIWTIPLGGGFGKVIKRDHAPINLKCEAYSYLDNAPADTDWTLMLSCEFLFSTQSLFK